MTVQFDTQMLIGSSFEAGTEGEETILNPRTGETILKLPEAGQAQIDRAVAAARKAFLTWSRTTPAQRSNLLLKIADRIEAEAEEFARLESLNTGKPINAALNDEIPAIVDCYRFFAGAARNMHGALAGEYMEGHTSMIRRDPIGVVASIAPWNYPLMMMAWKLAPRWRGELRGDEAVGADAAHGAQDGEAPGGAAARGGGEHRRGAGGERGQRPHQPPGRGHGEHHRGRGDGEEGAPGGVQDGEADASGARRQGAGDRVRRRGPGAGGERAAGLQLLQRGQDCTAACRVYAAPNIHDRLVAELARRRPPSPMPPRTTRRTRSRRSSRSGSGTGWRASSPARRSRSTSRW
jgi:aminobutyraldehyde dehydrogenase